MMRIACLVAMSALLGVLSCGDDAATVASSQDTLDAVDAPGSSDTGSTPDTGPSSDTGPDVTTPDDIGITDTLPDTSDAASIPDTTPPDTGVDTGPDPDSCLVMGCDTTNDNQCRKAKCVPETGECILTQEPNGKPCNDGDQGTSNDACLDGVCKGEVVACVCSVDGECKGFDDGNLCNGVFKCKGCKCVIDPDSIITCDTSGDTGCTKTACDPATGICKAAPLPNSLPCDDGDPCTPVDKCHEGVCSGELPANACAVTPNCAPLEDGNLCTGTLLCQVDANGCGLCETDPATVVTCQSEGVPPCYNLACSPDSGMCELSPVTDGAFCQLDGESGACEQGLCVKKLPSCVCSLGAAACDDGDACTEDTCADCACTHVATPGCCSKDDQCSDGDPCTLDRCDGGQCTNTAYTCAASAPGCAGATDTDPLCCDLVTQCAVEPFASVVCEDARCVTTPLPCDCDQTGICDDGDPCTIDACNGCHCAATPLLDCCTTDATCEDGDICTINTCDLDTLACQATESPEPACCNDSAECTGNLVCFEDACALPPKCSSGCDTAADCSDGDGSTVDTCQPGPNGCGVCHHSK